MPLDRHSDDGFRVVGDSFKSAADSLVENDAENNLTDPHNHLPINFLYRHAIELYLKSMITIVHRRLKLVNGSKPYNPVPEVAVNKKKKRIYSVHGTQALFDEMKRLVEINREALAGIAKTNWSEIPDNLVGWIKQIDQADPGSTVFRYPNSRSAKADQDKQSFKPFNLDELNSPENSGSLGKFVLAMIGEDDQVVESFGLDRNPMPELRNALIQSTELLSGAAFGLIMELSE